MNHSYEDLRLELDPDRAESMRAAVRTEVRDPSVFHSSVDTITREVRHRRRWPWVAAVAAAVAVAIVLAQPDSPSSIVTNTPQTTAIAETTSPVDTTTSPATTFVPPPPTGPTESAVPPTTVPVTSEHPQPAVPLGITAELVNEIAIDPIRQLPEYSSDGQQVVLGPGPLVDVVDAQTLEIVAQDLACPTPGEPLDQRWTKSLLDAVRSPSMCGVEVDPTRTLVATPNEITADPGSVTDTTLWEAATGATIATLPGRSLGFSATGNRLATYDDATTTSYLWIADDPTSPSDLPGAVVQYLPDGRMLLFGPPSDVVEVFYPGSTQAQFPSELKTPIDSISGDGRIGANESGLYDLDDFTRLSASDGSVGGRYHLSEDGLLYFKSAIPVPSSAERGIYESATGRLLFSVDAVEGEPPGYLVVGTISPDGNHFVVRTDAGSTDTQAQASLQLWQYRTTGGARTVPARATLAASADTGGLQLTFDASQSGVGASRSSGVTRLYNIDTLEPGPSVPCFTQADWTPLNGDNATGEIFAMDVLGNHSPPTGYSGCKTTFSTDRQYAIDQNLVLFETESGSSIAQLSGGDAAFSTDGLMIVTSVALDDSGCGCVRVWDGRTGDLRAELNTNGASRRVTISPDGSRIYTFGERTEIWDAETFEQIGQVDLPPIWGISFNATGSRVVTANFGRAIVWDVATESIVYQAAPMPGFEVFSAEISPDESLLVMSGTSGWSLVDLTTGIAIAGGSAQEGGYVARFTPDGTSVIVATDDTLERWAITRDSTELTQRKTLATLAASRP